MPYHIATIEILVETADEIEACDAISEALRPLLKTFEPSSAIVDWRYADDAASIPSPHSGAGFEYANAHLDFEVDTEWSSALALAQRTTLKEKT